MKKILVNAIDYKWTGGTYYTKNIAFLLKQNEYIISNYDICVCARPDQMEIFKDIDDIRLLCYTPKPGILNKLKKYLTYRKFDIVYPATSEIPFGRTDIVAWIPDFQHDHYPQFFKDSETNERHASYMKIAKAKFPLVLSSNDSKHDLFNYYYEKKNTYVVPFVSYVEKTIEKNEKCENEILSKYGLEEKKYVCTMNQFWQHKNHKVVFQAIQSLFLNDCHIDISFVFTGNMEDYRNPDYINSLKEIINDPVVFPHVKLLGFISREEQLALMKNAIFIIQPSLFEGWGTVVEDAKVLDKTILLSDIPVHREQMNEKCMLFDPYDPVALAELIYQESQNEHHDDVGKGIADMYKRAKEYSKGFEQLLKDLETTK